MSTTVQIALQDIKQAQEAGDITINQAGTILAETAWRVSNATGVVIDEMDLAVAVAAAMGLSSAQRMALIQAALRELNK